MLLTKAAGELVLAALRNNGGGAYFPFGSKRERMQTEPVNKPSIKLHHIRLRMILTDNQRLFCVVFCFRNKFPQAKKYKFTSELIFATSNNKMIIERWWAWICLCIIFSFFVHLLWLSILFVVTYWNQFLLNVFTICLIFYHNLFSCRCGTSLKYSVVSYHRFDSFERIECIWRQNCNKWQSFAVHTRF